MFLTSISLSSLGQILPGSTWLAFLAKLSNQNTTVLFLSLPYMLSEMHAQSKHKHAWFFPAFDPRAFSEPAIVARLLQCNKNILFFLYVSLVCPRPFFRQCISQSKLARNDKRIRSNDVKGTTTMLLYRN